MKLYFVSWGLAHPNGLNLMNGRIPMAHLPYGVDDVDALRDSIVATLSASGRYVAPEQVVVLAWSEFAQRPGQSTVPLDTV